MRQMIGIENALSNSSIVMEVAGCSPRPIPGAIINLNNEVNKADNGFYVCVYNSQGEGEWKKCNSVVYPQPANIERSGTGLSRASRRFCTSTRTSPSGLKIFTPAS